MRNEIIYGKWTFTDVKAANGKTTQTQDLASAELSADNLSVEVKCTDPDIRKFAVDAPVIYRYRGRQRGIYYLQSITRTGPSQYTLSALSAVSLLTKRMHPGGIYTGQTVEEVVKDICGTIPVIIKANLRSIKLYGWLPYSNPGNNSSSSSARDNLAQVLFAIGAYLGTDLNGVLRVEPLWDGIASSIIDDRCYDDGSVKYAAEISAVSVTEHQYVADPTADEDELFSGTAQNGDVITFSDPMHSLAATGFTIFASGANWARLSAGTGVLTGKKYIHNTREITETVTAGAAENVQPVTDATLVTLVNSSAVAKRLAEYYRCRTTISSGVVAGAERPGHVVRIYDPYDRKMVTACIASASGTMSATLKNDVDALVDFYPPQPDDVEYYDERVILTGAGTWTVPAGVTDVTAVLIGGGQGGWSGLKGKTPEARTSQTQTSGDTRYVLLAYSEGGDGGASGQPGHGGNVLQSRLQVTPGQTISYNCGSGGDGGVYNADESKAGADGANTSFGALSSADGAYSTQGYTDILTGELFAATGDNGVPGSKGHGRKWVGTNDEGEYEDQPSPTITVNGVTYTQGGEGGEDEGGRTSSTYGYVGWQYRRALGGGPAYGANGQAGQTNGSGEYSSSYARAYAATGGRGADALPPPKETAQYGKGGKAGNGGGGAGCNSITVARQYTGGGGTYQQASLSVVDVTTDRGGNGSNGGEGADGCVILYYRKPVESGGHGPFVTKDGILFCDHLLRRLIV